MSSIGGSQIVTHLIGILETIYTIIKLSAQKTQIIEGYYHQMYYPFVYNTSNQTCHNCILIIHAFSRVSKIVLQLLHNLPIKPNVCFLIIASKLYIP